jgi:hypothetical protein
MLTNKIVKWGLPGFNLNQIIKASSGSSGGLPVRRINFYPGSEFARYSKHLPTAKNALAGANLPSSAAEPLAFLTDKLKEIPVSVILNDAAKAQNVLFYVRFSGKNETFAVIDPALAEIAGAKAVLPETVIFSSEKQDEQVLGALVWYVRQRAAGHNGEIQKQLLQTALDSPVVPDLVLGDSKPLGAFLKCKELKLFLQAIGCQTLESYLLAKSGQVDEIVAVMLDCMNNRSEDLIKSRLRELARIEKNVMFPLNVSLQIEMELTTLAKKGVTPQVKKRSLEQLIKKMLNDNEGLLGCVQSVYEQQVKMLNTQAEHTLRESPVAKKLMGLMSELGRQLPKNVSIQVFSGRLDDLKKLVTLSPGSDRQTVEKVYQEVVARGHLTAQEAEEIRQAWQSLPQSVAETDVTTLYQIFRKVLGYGAELHLVEKTATLESETVSDLI